MSNQNQICQKCKSNQYVIFLRCCFDNCNCLIVFYYCLDCNISLDKAHKGLELELMSNITNKY